MATIRKRGDRYQVQFRRQGHKPVSKSFILMKDAETWARNIEVQADKSDLPADPKALKGVTLGQLVERYRDTVSCRKKGHLIERIVLNAFLAHPMCRKRLSEVAGADFATYRDQRLETIKPVSLRRQLAPIHNLFEVAKTEWGYPIRGNPLAGLKIMGIQQGRERRLRPGEFDRIIAAARECRKPIIEAIIRFALVTGMRRGEILAVRRKHIDLQRQSILVLVTKNGHARTIPLSSQAIALLRACPEVEGDDRIFPITANALRLSWERLKKRAKIDDLHFHDLRHEAISQYFEKGLTTPEVALLSGHRDMRMLFRYTHASRELVLEKLNSKE